MSSFTQSSQLVARSPNALGIAAASFWSVAGNGIREQEMGFGNGDLGAGRNEAEKDIAESPARSERPKERLMTKG